MDKEIIIINGRAFVGDIEYDLETGKAIIPESEQYDPTLPELTAPFSGIKNGKVIINNETTTINVEKFCDLPKSIRERILKYPNSDYTRDVLALPKGTITHDSFPNVNNLSYTEQGEAIIMNDSFGNPIREQFFLD